MSVVEFHSVSKSYPLAGSPGRRLGALLFPDLFPAPRFTALNQVSFEIRRGETFCIIGRNGAGKSTLLQLVAGIAPPTSGSVHVHGRISALLELGSGFHPDFTGRQNIFLSASILGFSAAATRRLFPHIAEFAAIGDFLERPVRTYSSGMLVRLAFAVAIHVEPEILIVDEALSVGDQAFRQRCLRKVGELRARGVTVLYVSHALGDVKALGDRALWLDHGSARQLGPAAQVADAYIAELAGSAAAPAAPRLSGNADWLENDLSGDARHGDARARICGFALFNQFGRPAVHLVPGGQYSARLSFEALAPLAHPHAALLIRNHLGIAFCGASTSASAAPLAPLAAGERVTVDFELTLPEFYPGAFSFSPCVSASAAGPVCDCVENALTLQMERAVGEIYGCLHVPARVRWSTPPLSQEVRRA
jgi:ABC-type polysaccharide/polyol phosphate transport system ATPase subunit